ncbi:Primase, C-terminal 2 [Burkholderiales bacterium]
MSDQEMQETFLQKVRQGPGYVARAVKGEPWQQEWCEDHEQMLFFTEDYQDSHNIYFSMATYSSRLNTRDADFADYLCSFWADVDRHENSPYKSDEEIEDAINEFLKKTGLPRPTIWHYTGYGIHIYWPLSAAIPRDEWLTIAEKLQALLDTLKVGADPITADASRVLRMPFTRNFRDPDNPVATRLDIRDRELISVDDFTVRLSKAIKLFPPPARTASTRPVSTGLPHTPENVAMVTAMLAFLDPDPADASTGNRHKWMRLIWSIAATGWGDYAYDIARKWSESGDLFDEVDFNGVWDSYDPNRQVGDKGSIGFGTLIYYAREAGYSGPTPQSQSQQTAPKSEGAPIHLVDIGSVDSSFDGWPQPMPLPDGLLPVEELDPTTLPSTISDAIVDISERLNCPIEFVAIPVLTAAGIALGNRIGVLPKRFDDSWEVYAGFWGGIVGSPGSMKTPAQNESFRCLHHLEEQAGAAYAQAIDVYNKDMKVYDKQVKDFKNGKTTVWPKEPSKPPKVRYIVNDVTYQALGEILAENPSGVLALADEMSGLLQSLDTPGQEAARGFFLQGWGGRGNYTFDRITRGTVVLKNYMLALFGGFQPDRIKLYVRAASSGSSQNDGLMQRFQLLVWPDLPEEVNIVDRQPDRAAINKMESAIIQLRSTATAGLAQSHKNSTGASLLHFDDQAQTLFDNWFRKNEIMLREGDLSQAEHSHFAKYRSLVPGLALVFHLLEGHSGDICSSCLDNALRVAAVLKSHAHRVYASVYGLDNEPARTLAKRLLKGDLQSGFTARTVYSKGWYGLSRANVTPALEQLSELGWLREVVPQTGGRPTIQYLINPNISADLLSRPFVGFDGTPPPSFPHEFDEKNEKNRGGVPTKPSKVGSRGPVDISTQTDRTGLQ